MSDRVMIEVRLNSVAHIMVNVFAFPVQSALSSRPDLALHAQTKRNFYCFVLCLTRR